MEKLKKNHHKLYSVHHRGFFNINRIRNQLINIRVRMEWCVNGMGMDIITDHNLLK